MRWTISVFLFGLLACGGCSRSNAPKMASEVKAPRDAPQNWHQAREEAEAVHLPDADHGPRKDGKPPENKPKAEPQRKIRYTADLRLIVEDFSKAEKDLETAIDDAKGRLANSELNSASGNVRTGTWRVRVPVENFQSFRAAVAKIGEVEKNSVDSEDLTDRYYDLEAHIKNRNAEREAMRDLLQEVGKKDLKHYIEVKRELDSITDDINRKEGQLRLWANLTDLTTVTVQMREKQKYIAGKPPETVERPTFGIRASAIWSESWDGVLGFCQWIALVVVALTPWLPVIAIFFGGVWLLVRHRWRTSSEQVAVVAEGPAESAKK